MQLLQPICFPTCCYYGAKRQSRSRLTDHRVLMARRGKRGMGAKACRMEGFNDSNVLRVSANFPSLTVVLP